MLYSLAITVVTVISLWKVFEKAGIEGWKALIPFYNGYLLFKIAGMSGKNIWWYVALSMVICAFYVFWLMVMFSAGGTSTESVLSQMTDDRIAELVVMLVLFVILSIVNIVLNIKRSVGLAHKFDQPTAFGVGMFFIPVIFYAILGFDSSVYDSNR